MLPTKNSACVVCIRWVDELLQDHEYVIGVYNVGTIDAKTVTNALEDVLLRAGLKIHYCLIIGVRARADAMLWFSV